VERFAQLAAASTAEQKAIEAADTLPFEEYRRSYLAVERLGTYVVPVAHPTTEEK
jgi:glutamate--cysteine ligase